ncbi:MAG: TonB-dependent receptor [Xanthomonadales bacterium]|nr:TonB-dependent receptor [Xanthomonadales bacterium]NIN58395.1 TonB-dependent receptor [Xanthomonadales bacterium]NIN73732.1 TonB-dependent receptor [Xanthomonadales bacterium]NIO14530.1 TonB-dependent receptor [Xanthomonadales bacterium]NIP10788.1 TonB-dependent receptor [Xanthomonadales bacterium]
MATCNLKRAISCALYAGAVATPGMAQEVIEELVVTATKRAESMQDIPIAVQAMGAEQLEDENIQSFSDYVKYLPSVNFGGRGPGQNEIYIRGAAVDAINITVAESQGSAPNVALYLDEQPITAGGRNLDIFVTDMERIEVLPGPQGTLYGASSMAGTVRLITNKPVLDEFQARFSGTYAQTHKGSDSHTLEAMINIPIIGDKLAFRAALYNDHQGGYIDNVEGTFQADPSINPTFPGDSVFYPAGTVFADGTVVGAGGVTIPVVKTVANNSASVKDDINTADYAGIRMGLKWAINDDWEALLQHTSQKLESEGVFDYDPDVGDLQVERFKTDSLRDEISQTAWTIDGRLGALDFIYTGAFLDREIDANIDYTGYTNIGKFIAGYQCEYLTNYTGYFGHASTRYTWDPTIGGDPGVIECGDPSNGSRMQNEVTRWTHEIRLSSDFDSPVNFTAGVFYEDFEIKHIGDFNYQAPIDAGWAPIDINSNPAFDNSPANARGVVNAATQFRNDNLRTEEQIALFGEVRWDITDRLTAALGARYYDLEYTFLGYGAWRYGNRPVFVDDSDPTNDVRPDFTGGRSYGTTFEGLNPIEIDDTILKFTLSYAATDNLLLYGTWSEGYRPPGFNRAAGAKATWDPNRVNIRDDGTDCGVDLAINSNPLTGFPGYCLPYIFESDTLDNLEFGWKSTLAGGTVQFNGSVYFMDWESIQVSQFDSQNISILTVVDNGGDAEIFGVEADLVWAVTDHLTLFAAGSYNDTELVFVDPAFDIVVADAGTALPLTPKEQITARARYDWTMGSGLGAYWQVAIKYAGESINSLVDTPEEPNTTQDSYTILDAAVGLINLDSGWRAELFGTNLTDERAQLHINRQDFFERTTTNRPRTLGIRFSYDY